MTKHTPEPWSVEPLDGGYAVIDVRLGIVIAWCNPAGLLPGEAHANTDRIVACVNACRGMADPAAEIARLREIEADAKAANLIGPDGRVRKVLGTLPLTDDECIIGENYEGFLYREPVCGDIERRWASVVVSNIDREYRWYSTPEAAEAARKGQA